MSKLEDYGELMLGTRLKRLSDRMYADLDTIYKSQGVSISSRCFALLAILVENGPMSISELANALGQSHASVSQVSKLLMKQNVINDRRDSKDERRRLLFLTDNGQQLVHDVREIWEDVKSVLSEAISESGFKLLEAISGLERQLDRQSLRDRMINRAYLRQRKAVEIIPYETKYHDDFKHLNVAWLEKYFYVEKVDDHILSNPEETIIEPGGYIFFARIGDEIVGTSALIKESAQRFELSKMSVTDRYQGLGIGEKLAVAAIEKFKQIGADTLFLESNRRLGPALKLYEKLGFEHLPPKTDSHYQRADVYMIYRP